MVVYASFNPCTLESEAAGSLSSMLGPGYVENPCVEVRGELGQEPVFPLRF